MRKRLARKSHPNCVICGTADPLDLGLKFHLEQDGSVLVIVRDGARLQGYPNQLHGGIISMLFDAAMTHCLFSLGKTAVTGELVLRFLHPVAADLPVSVKAWIKRSHSPLYILESRLTQHNRLLARATGKFMEVNALSPRGNELGDRDDNDK
jgi:acyl-coenzyme A thioesterase PaaI-like protein